MDSALARQAESLGVKLHFHQTLPKAEADIWAVGATCPAGVAKEMVFRTDLPDTFITLLDNRLTPQGFAYLFVIDGEATIGAAILADFNNLNEYFFDKLNNYVLSELFYNYNEEINENDKVDYQK